jgi:hypothetical protein
MIIYLGGYQIISACYRLELKMEAQHLLKTNLPDEYLSVFHFDLKDGNVQASSFEWEEEGKEFKYKNSLYDVVQIKESKHQIIIYCFNDSEENRLEKHLDQIHQQQNNPKASSTAAFQKLISLSFESVKNQDIYWVPSKLRFKYKAYDESVLLHHLEIMVPPPDELIES